ncbi:inactive polyglycylase TTLL10-like [Arapaima gigas]
MQQVVTQCFQAVKSKLERKLGYFDLIGCDFMIDENFKVMDVFWLGNGEWVGRDLAGRTGTGTLGWAEPTLQAARVL